MRKVKRIMSLVMAIILTLGMLLSFTGCGGNMEAVCTGSHKSANADFSVIIWQKLVEHNLTDSLNPNYQPSYQYEQIYIDVKGTIKLVRDWGDYKSISLNHRFPCSLYYDANGNIMYSCSFGELLPGGPGIQILFKQAPPYGQFLHKIYKGKVYVRVTYPDGIYYSYGAEVS